MIDFEQTWSATAHISLTLANDGSTHIKIILGLIEADNKSSHLTKLDQNLIIVEQVQSTPDQNYSTLDQIPSTSIAT